MHTGSTRIFRSPEEAGRDAAPTDTLVVLPNKGNPIQDPYPMNGLDVTAFEDAKPLWHPGWRQNTKARQKHDARNGIKPLPRWEEE